MRHRHLPLAKRRWLRFGPGLFLAVLASIAVWAFQPRQAGRPTIIRTPILSSSGPPSAPEPHWVLQHKDALGLTPAQIAALTRLAGRWDRETQPLRDEIEARIAAFDRTMAERSGKPMNLVQTQEEAASISALSRQLLEARQAWWADARRELSPAQRAQAEADWAARLAPPHKDGEHK